MPSVITGTRKLFVQRKKKGGRKKMAIVEVAKPSNPQPSPAFIKAVRKIVDKDTETKQAFHTSGDSLIYFNSGIDSVGDMQQLIPAISQGVGAHQRIGDNLRAKNLSIKGFIRLSVNDVSDSTKLTNVICRMMVVTLKTRPSYIDATASSAPLATLLKKGGTTVAFTGKLSDVYAPINTDVFTVHHDKKFYLSQSYVNVTGPSPPTTILPQDISKTIKFFKLNVKCKNKVLKYDEDIGSSLYPTNWGPMLLIGYAYLDGSSADTVSTNIQCQYDTTLNYEDA